MFGADRGVKNGVQAVKHGRCDLRATYGMGKMLDGAFADKPLQLGVDLFDRLNRSGIRYCHWKSNIRLAKSLAGKTDLDLLVAKDDADLFVAIAKECGFRRLVSRPEREYAGLSDYLGMDEATGGLLHLHLHDRLVLGGRSGKDIELPVEDLFWRHLEQAGNVRIPSPDLEFAILLLRAVVKSKPAPGTNPRDWFPSDIVDEAAVLYRRRDERKFEAMLDEIGLDIPAARLLRLAAMLAGEDVDAQEISRLRTDVIAALSPYRVRRDFMGGIRALQRTFYDTRWAKRNFLERKKRLGTTGLSIALVGVDGSGKSTHVEELRKWLGWKVVCRKEYFGLPKTSRLYRFLGRRAQTFEKRARSSKNNVERRLFQALAGQAQKGRWLWAAHVRARNARRVLRLVRRGVVVVCDRYPLAELARRLPSMDGPRIRHSCGGGLGAALEERLYRSIRRPDLTIVLRTGADDALRRKPELDADTVARKVDLVSGIAPATDVEIVDNGRGYDEVRTDLRRLIWRRLEGIAVR
jgi:thymidylate kinase